MSENLVGHNLQKVSVLEGCAGKAENCRKVTGKVGVPAPRDVVRWYIMTYPSDRRGLTDGLNREVARRERYCETPIEFFAPTYMVMEERGGRLVKTEKTLLLNYLFVKASEAEIFRMKEREPQYSLFRRRRSAGQDGGGSFPFVEEKVISYLRWIAESYSGTLPVVQADPTWLRKGDRVKLTKGQFKGMEATIYENVKSGAAEIMVTLDNCNLVPLLHVKSGQYELLGMGGSGSAASHTIEGERHGGALHRALIRRHLGELAAEDLKCAENIIRQFSAVEPESDIMRCKQFAALLAANFILDRKEQTESLLSAINLFLPVVKAEQARALLTVWVYGCTNSSLFHEQAHRLVDPWKAETGMKRRKSDLVRRLSELDCLFGHKE